jgi:hypothetical protein
MPAEGLTRVGECDCCGCGRDNADCLYRKPHRSVMPHWNRLRWRDDRAVLLRSVRLGLALRSKLRLEAENAVLRHQLMVLMRRPRGRVRLTNHVKLPAAATKLLLEIVTSHREHSVT